MKEIKLCRDFRYSLLISSYNKLYYKKTKIKMINLYFYFAYAFHSFNEKDHNLIPLEVFMSSAPAELTSTSDPHQLMVNRLNYEIQERKR